MEQNFTPGLINTTVDLQMELISGKAEAEKRNLCVALIALGMELEHIMTIMDRPDVLESLGKNLQEVIDEYTSLIDNEPSSNCD